MRISRPLGRLLLAGLLACLASAQVIEFESGGLRYQTLTKNGVTIMFAPLSGQIREFGMVQVAIANGSSQPCTVRPEDFFFQFDGEQVTQAAAALDVINRFVHDASGDDVVKLVTMYEMGLYGLGRVRSTNGYERRRQAALAVVSSRRLKAAAAASAIALVETELSPGQSTDGAVFFPVTGRQSGPMTLKVSAAGSVFEFEPTRLADGRAAGSQ